MAHQERNREDLLLEATALVERAEFQIAGESEAVVIGWRTNGAASIYFGQDVAYHFNSAGHLRRAFIEGRLIKAEDGQLASLVRHRSTDAVHLVRHDLMPAESAKLLAEAAGRINGVASALAGKQFQLLRQVPPDGTFTVRATFWLQSIQAPIQIAESSRVC